MRANLELYKIFCVVANSNSFSEAAKLLFISQSAVSQAMNQLESQLGTKLLMRSRKGVMLNEQGKILYTFASQAIGLFNAAEERLNMLKLNEHGKLSICAGETICKHFLMHKIKSYIGLYNSAKVELVNRNTFEAIGMLKKGRCEIGFANETFFDDSIMTKQIYSLHDAFYISANYKNINNKIFSVDELCDFNLLLLEDKCASREYINEYAKQRGIIFNPCMALASTQMLIESAKAGLGVACIAREYCKDEVKNGELIELKVDMPVPERNCYVFWLKDISLSVAAERFISKL